MTDWIHLPNFLTTFLKYKFINSCWLKKNGLCENWVAPWDKLNIFIICVWCCMTSWQAKIKQESQSEYVGLEFLCRCIGTKYVAFFIGRHLALTYLLSLYWCIFFSVRALGTAPVWFPSPLQKAIFTVRGVWESALLKASQDSWAQCCGAGNSYNPQNSNKSVFRWS